MSADLTVHGVPIKFSPTEVRRHRGYTTHIYQMLLGDDYKGHPEGLVLGTVCRRSGHRRDSNTSGRRNYGVLGIDHEWLVREFLEHDCGGLQSRLDTIQPGAGFTVSRVFGYTGLGHDRCYLPGDYFEVKSVAGGVVTTRFMRDFPENSKIDLELSWSLESFQSLATDYAIKLWVD